MYSTGQIMTRAAIDTQQMQGFVQQLTSGLLAQLIQLVVVGVALCRTPASGQAIDACGQFTLSGGCLVFLADSGGAFQLDTTPGLTQSDRIHVIGTVDTSCLPSCSAARC